MTEAPLIVPGSVGPRSSGAPGQDDLLAGLNPQQLEAVTYRGRSLLIVDVE
jgi:DNA helicase-2/ATP-dependent DNA helicase PcrA